MIVSLLQTQPHPMVREPLERTSFRQIRNQENLETKRPQIVVDS